MATRQNTRVRTDRAAQNDYFSLLAEAKQILAAIDLATDTLCRSRALKPEARRISGYLVEALDDLDSRAHGDLDAAEVDHAA